MSYKVQTSSNGLPSCVWFRRRNPGKCVWCV